MKQKLKIVIVLVNIITLISCQNTDKQAVQKKTMTKQPKSVVIINNGTTPILVDLTKNDYAIPVEMFLIGHKKNDTLVIPTDSILNLVLLNNYRYRLHFKFKKGDTITVSYKTILLDHESIQFPYCVEKHNHLNPYELNFDYYVSIRTPTIKTYPFYEGQYQFLNRNVKKFKREKIKFTQYDVYNNTKATLDSLYKLNHISEGFYKQQLKTITLDKARIKLLTAIKNNQKFDVNALDFSLQDNTLAHNESYLFYLRYQIIYRYFPHRKSVQVIQLFDYLIAHKTFLNKTLNNALLGKLLTEIYHSNKKIFAKKATDYVNYTQDNISKNFFKSLLKSDSINQTLMAYPKSNKELTALDTRNYDLKTLISDEKGKVILVDFWASWCVPCIKEFPSLKRLQIKFQKSKFKIISISIDANFSTWKNRLQSENLNTVSSNYIINTSKSNIKKLYNITTIPRYLLYNKRGVLINKDAPKPSDKNLEELILELIQKK